MANLNQLKRQVDKLEVRRSRLMRNGQIIMAMNLSKDITNIRKMIDEEEELRRPKPIKELVPKDELAASGLVELLIELHLGVDYLNAITCEIIDVVDKMGFNAVSIVPELKEIADKTQKFASYMCTKDENLSDMMTDNETLINALHKKTLSYIQQRFNRSKHAQ